MTKSELFSLGSHKASFPRTTAAGVWFRRFSPPGNQSYHRPSRHLSGAHLHPDVCWCFGTNFSVHRWLMPHWLMQSAVYLKVPLCPTSMHIPPVIWPSCHLEAIDKLTFLQLISVYCFHHWYIEHVGIGSFCISQNSTTLNGLSMAFPNTSKSSSLSSPASDMNVTASPNFVKPWNFAPGNLVTLSLQEFQSMKIPHLCPWVTAYNFLYNGTVRHLEMNTTFQLRSTDFVR